MRPQGTLSLSVTTVSAPHIVKPINEVFSLPYEGLMDRPTMQAITSKGYSRVPVYVDGDTNNILGYLLVKVRVRVRVGARAGMRVRVRVRVWGALGLH